MSKRALDPVRLSKTLSFLLRHKPEAGGLTLDADGWTPLDEATAAAGRLLKSAVQVEQVETMIRDAHVERFRIEDGRIRAVREVLRGPRPPRPRPPDILYHAISTEQLKRVDAQLKGSAHKPLFLSTEEAAAWKVAHRMRVDATVLYVDSTRARRHGVRFRQHKRHLLYLADRIPVSDVLNLQPNFAEQVSAGGIPMRVDKDGIKLALIRVTRRSGVTWEVAKGKLEPGETPEGAAVREVQEEMGIDTDLAITDYVGIIRYGFLAPGGLPRLKTVYLYMMEPDGDVVFAPRAEEGIQDVRWFSPQDALNAVTHSSLKPLMKIAVDRLLAQ